MIWTTQHAARVVLGKINRLHPLFPGEGNFVQVVPLGRRSKQSCRCRWNRTSDETTRDVQWNRQKSQEDQILECKKRETHPFGNDCHQLKQWNTFDGSLSYLVRRQCSLLDLFDSVMAADGIRCLMCLIDWWQMFLVLGFLPFSCVRVARRSLSTYAPLQNSLRRTTVTTDRWRTKRRNTKLILSKRHQ